MKKLKLRIAKFDRLLVVEQLEREGEWKNSTHVYVQDDLHLYKSEDRIDLQEDNYDENVAIRKFDDNVERDEYTENLIDWITEEQFGGSGKLEVGKPCLVRDEEDGHWGERIYAGKVAKQLGGDKCYLAKGNMEEDFFWSWKYVKPLNSAQPKIDGDVYTWETEE